jgi:hypothetical protein
MAGQRDEHGLTAKQRKFAESLVNGLSQADAYRNAFDAENMAPETIRNKASLLARRDDVRAAVDAIGGERVRMMETKGLSDRTEVVALLRKFATDDDRPDAIRLRAVELWGKTCGAFVEVVEERRERGSASVAMELEHRLAALLSHAAPQVTVIEHPALVHDDDDSDSDDDGAGSGVPG